MSADGIPTSKEIARQLRQILASEILSPQPAKLLKYIVHEALHDRLVTEAVLRKLLFDRKVIGKAKDDRKRKDNSDIVRVTMTAVRKSLTTYYTNEGKGDLIIIDASPRTPSDRAAGKAYHPRFRYNPRHQAAQAFERIERLVREGDGPNQILNGLQLLPGTYAPGEIPDYSYLLFAEGLVRLVVTNWQPAHHSWLLSYARQVFTSLERAIPDRWRLYMGLAAIDTLENKFTAASRRFDRAAKLDREATLASAWYALFLLKAGHRKKFLAVAELYGEEITDPVSSALRGVILLRAGLIEDSRAALLSALELDRNCWPAHLGLALWHCLAGDMTQTELHAQRLRELMHPDDLACLANFVLPALDDSVVKVSAPLGLPASGNCATS